MPRAAIDIGSNSLLVTVVDDDGRTLVDESRIVGLGKGLGDRGLFQADPMHKALEVLAEFTELARSHGVPPIRVQAAATSAARRALNAKTFFERVKEQTGLDVQVVSGDDEARLTWLGARMGLGDRDDVVVFDLGGGSTEVVMGSAGKLTLHRSLELGSSRLTEDFLGTGKTDPADLARCREHVKQTLATLEWPRLPRGAVAVGGTATTLAAMELGLTDYDSERVHGTRLDRAALRRWMDRLLMASPEQRRQLCAISPERADAMLAGVVVLEACCEAARRESVLVSTGGLRHGLLAS